MSTRFEFTSRARPILEVGLGGGDLDGPALWDQSRWDQPSATWGGTEPDWVEVGCDIVNARCQLGRERITDQYLVGLADLVIDNVGRWADPSTQTIPDQFGNTLRLRPGRQIRFGVAHTTLGTRWLFRGWIDSIDPIDDANQTWAEVRMHCIDTLGEVGRAKVASSEIVGDQTVDQRAHDILNRSVRLAESKRLIDPISTALIAYQPDGQVVDLLRRAADSGGGWVFGDNEGRLVLRNRDWLIYVQGSEPDFYISNMAGGAGGTDPFTADSGGYTADATVTLSAIDGGYSSTNSEFTAISGGYTWPSSTSSGPPAACPTSWERSFNRNGIATRVILDRNAVPTNPGDPPAPDPEPHTYDDSGAQTLYGVEPWERRDLWTRDDEDLDAIGRRVLRNRSVYFSMPRVHAANIDAAAGGDAAVDLLSTVDVYAPTRVRGQFRDRSGTLVFDDDFYVVGITHEITADNWIAKVQLDRSEPYAQLNPGPYAWDTANWDRALWN